MRQIASASVTLWIIFPTLAAGDDAQGQGFWHSIYIFFGGRDVAAVTVASLALVVSIISIVAAFIALYFNTLRSARLRMQPGSDTLIGQRGKDLVAFDMNLVIFNEGAKSGAVFELNGTIARADNRAERAGFTCESFMRDINLANVGEPTKFWRHAEGRVAPIYVAGQSAAVLLLRFCTTSGLKLREGTYRVELETLAFPEQRVRPVVRSLNIKPEAMTRFRAKNPESDDRHFERIRLEPAR